MNALLLPAERWFTAGFTPGVGGDPRVARSRRSLTPHPQRQSSSELRRTTGEKDPGGYPPWASFCEVADTPCRHVYGFRRFLEAPSTTRTADDSSRPPSLTHDRPHATRAPSHLPRQSLTIRRASGLLDGPKA